MSWKRKSFGGAVGFVGFLLSPLSWWNDLVINLPLALAFAWVISCFHPPAFKVAVIVGYWITNVLGFWMMHRGIQTALTAPKVEADPLVIPAPLPLVQRPWMKDMIIASGYTGLILVLMKLEILKPISELSQ